MVGASSPVKLKVTYKLERDSRIIEKHLWLLLHHFSSIVGFVHLPTTDSGKGAQDLLLALNIADQIIRSEYYSVKAGLLRVVKHSLA